MAVQYPQAHFCEYEIRGENVIITSATTSIPGNNMGCVPDWQPYSVNE